MNILQENTKEIKRWLAEKGFKTMNETKLGDSYLRFLVHPNGMKTIMLQIYDDGGFNIWYDTKHSMMTNIKDEILDYIK